MSINFYRLTASVFLILFLSSYSIIAQTKTNDSLTKPLILELEGKKKMVLPDLSVFIEEDNIIQQEIDSLFEDNSFMEEYWATNTFNPYMTSLLKYPFNISFKDSSYTSPIERKKVITSRYGWRRGRAHHGIDIDLISGDDVRAMFDGKVRYVKYHGGHGKTVIVRHNNGLETVYAHLSKQLVKENDTVLKGQVIGKGGVTGNARGSHLHLEVRYKGQSINPEYLFNFNEENNIRAKELWVTKKWTNPLKHRSTRQSKIITYSSLDDALSNKKPESTIYVIKRGDTLWSISRNHQLSISQICKLNAIRKNAKLKIGQRLVLN